MKKTNLFLTCAIASCALITSCKEDVEDTYLDGSGQVKETAPGKVTDPEAFASLSPEENKRKLEDDGFTLLSNMEDLSSSPAIDVSTAFVGFLDQAPAEPANGRLSATSRTLKRLGDGKASAQDIFASLRTAEEEPESIQKYYEQYTGVWSWNAETKAWDHQAKGDKIIFEFPSTENGTQNNAQYTVHSYEGLLQDHPYGDYQGDLPTKIVTELTVDGGSQATYSFSAAYNKDGEPEQLTTSLSVNSFVFSILADNNTEEVGIQYSLKRDNKTLLAMGSGAYGNFSGDHILSLEDQEDAHQGDIVNRVDAYFQVMNVVLAGDMDIKKYLDGAKDNYEFRTDEYGNYQGSGYNDTITENNAQLLEEAFKLSAFYADGSGKIADTEVYTYTDSYTTYEPTYDDEGYYLGSKEKEVEYQSMNIRLVFEDESKADLDTYFGEGFEDLVKEFDKFAEDLEEKGGE